MRDLTRADLERLRRFGENRYVAMVSLRDLAGLIALVEELAQYIGRPPHIAGCLPCGCRRVRTAPMPHEPDCIVSRARALLGPGCIHPACKGHIRCQHPDVGSGGA